MSSTETPHPFLDFLRDGLDDGGFKTLDVLAAVLPLMRQVLELHENEQIAPLDGIDHLRVQQGKLWFEDSKAQSPMTNRAKIKQLQAESEGTLKVVSQHKVDEDVDLGDAVVETDVADPEKNVKWLAYYPNYVSWELLVDHHDQLTDVFALGMITASLAFGLDFTSKENVQSFVNARGNLFLLNPDMHPVVVSAVVSMTELNRHRRAQDLSSVISCLENYRDQPTGFQPDFHQLRGFKEASFSGKQDIILSHLRDRLFEVSRRNRVLYFRPTMQTLDLTEASVPILLDHRNIREDQLFFWHADLASRIREGKDLNLGRYLNFDDLTYLPSVLNNIRTEANRQRKEFGFAQLRLVLVFLRWHNLKEAPEERIHSPLLLLPVNLVKKKGVRDSYLLEIASTEAEVNPILRHHLKVLYDLDLPEAIDLCEANLLDFHRYLESQIKASEPGVDLKLIDKPQIDLIYESAKKRLDSYERRRRLSGRNVRRYADEIDYSYSKDRYRPLGLQLYLQKVKVAPSPYENVLREKPSVTYQFMSGSETREEIRSKSSKTSVRSRTLYSLRRGSGDANPYAWDFDLCSVTMGNFNYRKMSLVRDYSTLLEEHTPDRAFEEVFSTRPRDLSEPPQNVMQPEDMNLIVPCDPTQASAISMARNGQSYIIQGPPGTGKSQTITNLIADYVACGKRVLFVCEKRAAIDVVFHRLAQQGLDSLATLIHDSQTDKKEFVFNLKETYERFIEDRDCEAVLDTHKDILTEIHQHMSVLKQFSDTMTSEPDGAGTTLNKLVAELIRLRDEIPELSAVEVESLSPFSKWVEFGSVAERLSDTLAEIGQVSVLAQLSIRHLNSQALHSDEPIRSLTTHISEAQQVLSQLERIYRESSLDGNKWDTFGELMALSQYVNKARPIANMHLMRLLDSGSRLTSDFTRLQKRYQTEMVDLEAAKEKNTHWIEKLSHEDTEEALDQAKIYEASILRFIQPGWWKLKGVMKQSYDFSKHRIRPKWSKVLKSLLSEHEAFTAAEKTRKQFDTEFSITSIGEFEQAMAAFTEYISTASVDVTEFHRQNLLSDEPDQGILALAALDATVSEFHSRLDQFMDCFETLSIEHLSHSLCELAKSLEILPDILPMLLELHETDPEFLHSVKSLPLTPNELKAAMADKCFQGALREARFLNRFSSLSLEHHLKKLRDAYAEWMKLNADAIIESVRNRFLQNIDICSKPASQLSSEQVAFKKAYNAGRREVEHEFSKVMRHKSIRDLSTGDSGLVLQDLKPIWLMSPLSIADTLPLISDFFDVVIFDEASQVKVEDAVPAIFRATQAIVVGDEMQLPPTTFFASSQGDDDQVTFEDESGDVVEFDLNFESLLTQAARNLPSVLLGWHYRSRYEALIGFSNANFYGNKLLTIPDQQIPPRNLNPIVVHDCKDGEDNVQELLARSISFHHLEGGIYEKRRNFQEASYIAHLVRELLTRETGLSIGIVAFSEAQQAEIEAAMNTLGQEDKAFANRLDEEMEREEDGQFCGLFVKNLENVQGDERDIIILSICYGYDRQHQMRMNFGPINKTGGEKRLNVIFSRAKLHMAVVSSIRHHAITNDYNDGARCLKSFLEYAAAVSEADIHTANRVLKGLHQSHEDTISVDLNPVVAELKMELQNRGYEVETNVGNSEFRCSLAVRQKDVDQYDLGILVDTDAHYQKPDLLERYHIQPEVLRAFGWKIAFVISTDWLQNQEDVLRRLERILTAAEPEENTVDFLKNELEETRLMQEIFEQTSQSETTVDIPFLNDDDEEESEEDEQPIAEEETEPVLEHNGALEGYRTVDNYLEYREGSSSKFWHVWVEGSVYSVNYGRIGTNGQTKSQDFESSEAAIAEAEKMTSSKLRKGYSFTER